MAADNEFLVTFRISAHEVGPIIELLKDRAQFLSAARGSDQVLAFDDGLVAHELVAQIDRIVGEKPTNEYHRGYLHALNVLYRLGRGFPGGHQGDDRTRAAEQVIDDVYVPPQSAKRSRRR